MSAKFSQEFRRKILALAVRSDLLHRAPEAFQAELFGEPGAKTDAKAPPLQRLADILIQYGKQYRNQRPGVETMNRLVEVATASLRPEERHAVEAEWTKVRELEVTDPDYVLDSVIEWARTEALTAAIVTAAKLIEDAKRTGRPLDAQKVLRTVSAATAIGAEVGVGGYWLDGDWSHWDPATSRRRIATRLGRLDSCLDGGPSLGETFFILAPPKGAKTATLLNIAHGALIEGRGVAWFSYEMQLAAMKKRMDRRATLRTKRELMEAFPRMSPLVAVRDGMELMDRGKLHFQEFLPKRHGCAEAARVVERLRGEGVEIDVVVLDYLTIMAGGDGMGAIREKRHELAAISRDMSALAKELDVVVWSAQLTNRQAENKVPITKDDIAESFEVISVLDGAISVCSNKMLRSMEPNPRRVMYLAALRDAEDQAMVGVYETDLDRMLLKFDAELTETLLHNPDALSGEDPDGGN